MAGGQGGRVRTFFGHCGADAQVWAETAALRGVGGLLVWVEVTIRMGSGHAGNQGLVTCIGLSLLFGQRVCMLACLPPGRAAVAQTVAYRVAIFLTSSV